MKNVLMIILLGTVIVSCSFIQERAEKKRNKKKQIEKEKIISSLAEQYNITYSWDTLDYKYSIDYKDVIESKYQIIDVFSVNDIYKKSGNTYIAINVGWFPRFYFDFPITKEQEKILRQTGDFAWNNSIILLVSIKDIRKIKLNIDAECEVYDEDDYSAYIRLDSSRDFIGKGEIVDIKFY